jgi:hypothetical protein
LLFSSLLVVGLLLVWLFGCDWLLLVLAFQECPAFSENVTRSAFAKRFDFAFWQWGCYAFVFDWFVIVFHWILLCSPALRGKPCAFAKFSVVKERIPQTCGHYPIKQE